MTETAMLWEQEVIPHVPVRQWVLSMPKQVRYHLARKGKLRKRALKILLSEIFALLKRKARERTEEGRGQTAEGREQRADGLRGTGDGVRMTEHGRRGPRLKDLHGGSVTVAQRFGSTLNLNVHFHCLVIEGVYIKRGTGVPEFVAVPPPTNQEIQGVVERTGAKITAMMVKAGVIEAVQGQGPIEQEQPDLYQQMQAASIKQMLFTWGPARWVPIWGRREGWVQAPPKALCGTKDGYSLHAGIRVEAHDRSGLEKLARYLLRPPMAQARLSRGPQGQVIYELGHPRLDGGTAVVLEPMEFLEKIAALVPSPRENLVHYHGVLAPNSKLRSRVVPSYGKPKAGDGEQRSSRNPTDWASLMQHAFEIDVLSCPKCGGRMRLIALIKERRVIRRILEHLGIDPDPPEAWPIREPVQPAIWG